MPTDPYSPEPPIEEQGFRVMDLKFWAAIVFLVACLIAAGVVAFWGPKIWPKAPQHPAPAVMSAPPPASPARR